MTMHFEVPALQRSLRDVVEEYTQTAAEIPAALAAFHQAAPDLETAACVGGAYAGDIWVRSGSPRPWESTLTEILRKSAWRHVYDGLNIDQIASAKDRRRFELAMENPPEFTIDNLAATFGDYVQNPRFHILRGLAEVFCDLDPAYKSHSKVKIGVKGLPKRVILSGFGRYDWGSHGQQTLKDVLNALAVFKGQPMLHNGDISDMVREAEKHGTVMWWGGELRIFKNGNGHLYFDTETLREINLTLAEFYADTLPDSPEDVAKRRPGTEVSTDLAYYPTPQEVAERVLAALPGIEPGMAVLEPSCGCGRLLTAIRDLEPKARITGIEYDDTRATEALGKGFNVLRANFLETEPDPVFDRVVMNPPFNGLHWRKHLDHARRFLKPGGWLVAILPATACYDGHLDDLGVRRQWTRTWTDLPVASLAASGTNVPTGYIVVRRQPD